MNTVLNCPACGQPTLGVERAQQTVTARDGTVLHFEDEQTRCRSCSEIFYMPDQSLGSSRARAAALRTHDRLLAPVDIRQIRNKYGLSQAQLEQALGVGAKTVVRWERGSVCQSNAANNLRLIARDFPPVFAQIARRNGVEVGRNVESLMPRATLWDRVVFASRVATIDCSTARVARRGYGRFRTLSQSTCEQSPRDASRGCFDDDAAPRSPID